MVSRHCRSSSAKHRLAVRGEDLRQLHAAARSISRSSSMNGTPSASAASWPSVVLPAPAQPHQRDAALGGRRSRTEALCDQLARLGQLVRRQPLQLMHGKRQVDRLLGLVAHQGGGLDAQGLRRSAAAPAARRCRRPAPARRGSAPTRRTPATAPCATCRAVPDPDVRARRPGADRPRRPGAAPRRVSVAVSGLLAMPPRLDTLQDITSPRPLCAKLRALQRVPTCSMMQAMLQMPADRGHRN